MKIEDDKNGNNFWYFILPVYVCILLPITFLLWPKTEEKKIEPYPIYRFNFAPNSNEYRLLHANKPNRRLQTILTSIGLVMAWIVLIFLAYRISLIETEHEGYDPFAVLGVDHEASISEIRQIYHELSKKHHPDRGGDPEKFKEIAEAYRTLTDEEAKENWRRYGNPDGPRVIRVGYAMPKWVGDPQNSIFILSIVTILFLIVLPVTFVYLLK